MSKGDNDQLLGGSGKDTMHGNGGRDYLNGEWDHDTLFGDNGNDLIYGGFGPDNLYGGNGNDVLYGGSAVHPNGAWFGRPIVVDHEGGTGRSIGAQAWSIAGESQATDTSSDYLSGGAGNDVLYGQGGRDRLLGGTGDDKLIGGLHRDVMTGGTGKDTFIFNSTHDSYASHPDVITDFQHGVDKIDLSAIDGNPTRAGNQTLAFIGLKPFGSAHGEVRWDGSHVYVDLNSDGTPDMSFVIEFHGAHRLDKYDFVL
jgi:Ca2+-binding RTX toxin-like protein